MTPITQTHGLLQQTPEKARIVGALNSLRLLAKRSLRAGINPVEISTKSTFRGGQLLLMGLEILQREISHTLSTLSSAMDRIYGFPIMLLANIFTFPSSTSIWLYARPSCF
jgi:hypothetical protein